MMEIETRVAGIPCLARVTYYQPGLPALRRGHPDGWEPEEPPEVEFDLLDRRGRPADWLAAKLTGADVERIECEILGAIEQEALV